MSSWWRRAAARVPGTAAWRGRRRAAWSEAWRSASAGLDLTASPECPRAGGATVTTMVAGRVDRAAGDLLHVVGDATRTHITSRGVTTRRERAVLIVASSDGVTVGDVVDVQAHTVAAAGRWPQTVSVDLAVRAAA